MITTGHVTENFALIPYLQVVTEDALAKRMFVEDKLEADKYYRLGSPLGFELDWRNGAEDFFTLAYAFKGLGLPSDLRVHMLRLSWHTAW